MPSPRFLGYPALLGEPKPINWSGIGQALWDTDLNAPIRGIYNLMNADPYTLYTDEGEAGQQLVADSFDAAGGITVGSMPMPKPANSLSMGIKAYHGSPHSFEKFSMDKIGTGEGAQAYGHGLYFAENEGVARSYKQAGVPTYRSQAVHNAVDEAMQAANSDRRAALEYLNSKFLDAPSPIKRSIYQDALNNFDGVLQNPVKGSMYEVEINADPNAFLDWDKPLSEQPEAVRKAVARDAGPEFDKAAAEYSSAYDAYMSRPENPTPEETAALERAVEDSYQRMIELRGNGNLTGAGVYHELAKGQPWALGAEELRKAGIPGIKYLDAGSRGAGDGTRNYVVFDDKLISIVKKYGIAGASAMLGYNLLEGVDKAQAAELQQADTHHQYTNWLSSGGI